MLPETLGVYNLEQEPFNSLLRQTVENCSLIRGIHSVTSPTRELQNLSLRLHTELQNVLFQKWLSQIPLPFRRAISSMLYLQ